MSKAVYVFVRNKEKLPIYTERLRKFTPSLIPDNIKDCPVSITSNGNILTAIINTRGVTHQTGNSLCLGQIFGDTKNWDKPYGSYPDGAFCIFRSDENNVEILSDVGGSRTIWHYKDEDVFIASNSQRAIVALIKNFKFNEKVISWVLSTGTLGPGFSWDSRISMLGINSSGMLDINKWEFYEKSEHVYFNEEKISEEQQEFLFTEKLDESFVETEFDFSKWILPLSGGLDSRAILFFLKKLKPDFQKLRTITWGVPGAINRKGNDAFIAKEIADTLKLSHEYYHLQAKNENINEILNRFLICGEGRVDALSGYTDGFYIWKVLFDKEIIGILRGDQTFGGRSVSSEKDALDGAGINFCSDYSNLSDPELNLPSQLLPEYMNRQKNESLLSWKDRLVIEYRSPVFKAALNDLKLSYVEISTPLITKGIINRTLKMSDSQRLERSLFKKLINKISLPIDYATEVAIETPTDIFNSPQFLDHFKKQLVKDYSKQILPEAFYNKLMKSLISFEQKLGGKPKKLTLKDRIKKLVPIDIKKRLVKLKTDNSLNIMRLAFRAYIITRMVEILTEDSNEN